MPETEAVRKMGGRENIPDRSNEFPTTAEGEQVVPTAPTETEIKKAVDALTQSLLDALN